MAQRRNKNTPAKTAPGAAALGEAVSPAPAVMAPEADEPLAAMIDRAVADVIAPAKQVLDQAGGESTLPHPTHTTPPAVDLPVMAAAEAPLPLADMKDETMENDTTTTTTADFAQKIKETAADAQTRAKAAYDKLQAYSGDMTEFTKGNVEALVESGKILGQGMQDIARSEIEAAKGAFETVTADLRAMAAVKSPTELFKLQGEIARRNFDAAVARASKNAEVSVKLANDAFAPISSRMSVAAERMSNAA